MSSVSVIVNPVSGTGRRHDEVTRRRDLATAAFRSLSIPVDVRVTEAPGHGRALAAAAREAGAAIVVAWGGDGTVNEVASALVGSTTALGVVPSGSGNGLARELGIPMDPGAALAVARDGMDRVIDAGEVDGRVFVNVAGIGLDAGVAHRFARAGGGRRGLRRYVEATAGELLTFRAQDVQVSADGTTTRVRPQIVAIANTRQYGNGALIAPDAHPDDGQLDLVVIDERSLVATLLDVPKLFSGRIASARGVGIQRVTSVTLSADKPLRYHVDGEPCVGGTSLVCRMLPGALRVRVPRS